MKLGVIGAGTMGTTLLKGWLSAKAVDQAWAAARSQETCDRVSKELGIPVVQDFEGELAGTQVLILATKPAQFKDVYPRLEGLPEDCVVVSVAAGITLGTLESNLDFDVIRAMPNTPAQIGLGMTLLAKGKASEDSLKKVQELFEAVGGTVVLPENLYDAGTAMSGSGPAFVYMMLEGMMRGGTKMGLSSEQSMALATQTAQGAAALLSKLGADPQELRRQVATPGGCTEAGVKALEGESVVDSFALAIERATLRAKEMG